MNYYVWIIAIIFLLISCQQEKQPIENAQNVETESQSTPIKEEMESQVITNENFQVKEFQVKVPEGFYIKPSVGETSNFDEFKSYFFTSPDSLVQFYVYMAVDNSLPNDIVFPNEKIKSSKSVHEDTVILKWQLPAQKQTGYHRSFTQKTFDNNTMISGYYYKDSTSYNRYLSDFNKFEDSFKH